MFNSIYNNKTVLVTGHTGFKGSWLCHWLCKLGANVVGFSNQLPSEPSLFDRAGIATDIVDIRADICDLDALEDCVASYKPDFVFHLAAQALVSASYHDPIEAFTTNVLGTASVLQSLRNVDWPCTAVMITSDKCYDNVEWAWGYRETDSLGGKDIYSGSKGAAELAIKSFFHSYFDTEDASVKLGVARAGNVIGGGDWAKDRIVVDAVKAWSENQSVIIRSPNATRPWQHVLEPLSGYLSLGQNLASNSIKPGEAYNFGPDAAEIRTVSNLLEELFSYWSDTNDHKAVEIQGNAMHEANLLKLNCDKALFDLKWTATLSFTETCEITSNWYKAFYIDDADPRGLCDANLDFYLNRAMQTNKHWAK